MTLYNLVNIAANRNEQVVEEGDVPSYMKIGTLPFSRLYLVSRDKEIAQQFADEFNQDRDDSIDFRVQQLSRKGVLKFYGDRYILGNLSFILGQSMDLDSGDEKIANYINWYSSVVIRK